MVLKERQSVAQEVNGVHPSPESIVPPRCDIQHSWNFEQNGHTNGQLDQQLKGAIRHMVSVKHEIGGETYGGLELDDSISEKLSLSLFAKTGLLKPVATRFRGNIDSVVEFADLNNPMEACRHHWLIESPHGPTCAGFCNHCGITKEFQSGVNDYFWEDDTTVFIPSDGSQREVANQAA